MDFDGRISSAQKQANSSMKSYNEFAGQANVAGTKFNNAFDNRQGFDDTYQSNLNRFYNTDEVNAARDTYQNARNAVDQLNTTINKMPESIRQQYGGTGLTEAQRQRALSDQYQQNANTYNMLNTNYGNASADYNDLAGRGMQLAQFGTTGAMQDQANALNMLQNSWSTLLGQRNTAYSNNLADRGLLADQYGARDQNKYQQQLLELERWKQQQENYRTQLDVSKYLAAKRDSENLDKPSNSAQKAYQAPVSTDKSKAPAEHVYKAWDDSPWWQKVAAAPLMMFNGY